MKLEQLLEGVPFTLAQGSLDTEISDIIYDSRKAAPGLLFVCIVGTQRDSHEFAADCAAKGVSALVIQHDIDLSALPGVTVVKVESSRYAMALMSANLFGNPSRKMTMIGVTGTKGKTTTTHMIKSVLEAAGRKVGMIGTNGIYYMGRHKETANTTPESYELQKTFREFLDAGCDTALMEVSRQGLMMDRVAGVHYDVGVFTNLSPDHIGPGEHKTFEEYRSWKGQLFKRCDVGVVNIDDENTEALLEGHTCKLVTYGRDEKADYRETGYELLRTHDFLGVKFHVTGKDEMDVKVNMPGEFSVYNALAALAVGKVLGLPDQAIHDGLGKCVVKGRVELVPISKKFTILLDYAHNEVSTESLLTIAFNVSLQKYGGDAAVGAMTILTSVAQMVQLPLTGLAQGAQPILSYACGAKRPDRMKRVVQLNLAAAFVFAFSIWAAVQLFPHTVVHLFTSDEELVERTVWALRVYFALGFTNAFQTGFQQSFVALGEARISLFLALERKVFLLIPFILILPHFFADKLFAVFLAEPVADLLAAATTTTLFLIRFKQITRDM